MPKPILLFSLFTGYTAEYEGSGVTFHGSYRSFAEAEKAVPYNAISQTVGRWQKKEFDKVKHDGCVLYEKKMNIGKRYSSYDFIYILEHEVGKSPNQILDGHAEAGFSLS